MVTPPTWPPPDRDPHEPEDAGLPKIPMDEETWLAQQKQPKPEHTPPADTPAKPPATPAVPPKKKVSHPFPHDDELFVPGNLTGADKSMKKQRRPYKRVDDGTHHLDRPRKKLDYIDFEADPLLRLEDNRRSVRHAITYAIMIPVITLITGAIIAIISRYQGGPICDGGYSTWICTRTHEILFPVLPGIISFGGMIGAGIITCRQWYQQRYWQPWLGIVWILIPFSLMWAMGVGAMAIVGQH